MTGTQSVPQISRRELIARLHDPSLTIVNVLPEAAWKSQRIRGSISLPVAEIAARSAAVLPDREAEIAVYCASPTCDAGARAVRLLQERGYKRVRDFDGGISEWIAADLPVESGDILRFPSEPKVVRSDERKSRMSPLQWVSRRSIGSLLGTWLLINFGCGLVYWAVSFFPGHGVREAGQPMAHDAAALLEAVYFSFVTGLSIGFGDIVPVGFARVLAVIQGGTCLLVFGAIISKLVSGRQEELTEEIHRIAFEDRLGRVRTNLHLVVSEIQEIAVQRGDGRATEAGVQTRIEGAAAIFTGELRAIHDLLYRPQTAADEDVLESILAQIEGGLREFGQLLLRMTAEFRDTPALVANVRMLATLASEICGTCVPREYAPHLTIWMDRIQAHARGLLSARA